MADVFISYSRKDSEHAMELANQLRAWGIEVWIDFQGIDAADIWPKEIVQAIWACKAFLVLLSESSLRSTGVLRELSLAIEKEKPILPVRLSALDLTEDFAYQLAGVQHVSAKDIDAIERSLRKIGVPFGDQSVEHLPKLRAPAKLHPAAPADTRLSLIVLPFEDLSPPGENNMWFADGLAGELIDALSHVRSLRILDRKTSLGLRGVKLRTVEIGREYHTRYFIEGSVRKFGEEIKTSVSLLDIETGDYLWQESFRGEFKDIFDIQESVAKSVVGGLKLHLTKQETSQIVDHGTKDTEAYKLFVKAQEYLDRHTREGFQFAVELVSRAIEHDPSYAAAFAFKADALANLYRTYHGEVTLLEAAKQLANHALELKPDLWEAYAPLALIHQLQGDLRSAEAMAHRYVAHAPQQSKSYYTLATVLDRAGDYASALAPYEKAVERNPDSLASVWNLVLAAHHAGETEKRVQWASTAIPLFERHLKFHPEDEFQGACYASLLHFAERDAEAKVYAEKLSTVRDGTSLYSLACLHCELGDLDAGVTVFRKALDAGYRNVLLLDRFFTSSTAGIGSRAGTPEFEELHAAMERLSNEARHV